MNYKIVYSDYILDRNDKIRNISDLKKIGADSVEIFLKGGENLNFLVKNLPDDMNYSVHPKTLGIDISSMDYAIRERSVEYHKEVIDFAEKINASYVVIHPGTCCDQNFKDAAQCNAKKSILNLSKYSSRLNIKLAVENIGNIENSLYKRDEFCRILDDVGFNCVYLIDIGHAFLNGWNVERTIEELSERLIAVHIHDNDGIHDDHMPVGCGKIEWKRICTALKKYCSRLYCVFEYSSCFDVSNLERSRRIFESKLLK